MSGKVWAVEGWRHARQDRNTGLILSSSEKGERYRYRCMSQTCGKKWKTTAQTQRQCPFCGYSKEIQRAD